MTLRLVLALTSLIVAAVGVTIVTSQRPPERPEAAGTLVPALPRAALNRANRGERRPPLRDHSGSRPSARASRSGGHSYGQVHDVTMYCATGNHNAAGRWPQLGDVAVADRSIPFGTHVRIAGATYTVEDWIGWGSDFDIYGGSDPGCESRALEFGRQHLTVLVER